MTHAPPDHHDRHGILIEKRLRGMESPRDQAELDGHLAACASCRRELSAAMQEVATMTTLSDTLTGSFDFDGARRAIDRRLRRRRARALALLGLSAAALVLFVFLTSPRGLPATLLVALAAAAPLAAVGLADRLIHRRIRARLAAGDVDLVDAFTRHLRGARRDAAIDRTVVALSYLFQVALGVTCIVAGHDVIGWILLAIVAVMLVPQVRLIRSRAARRRGNG